MVPSLSVSCAFLFVEICRLSRRTLMCVHPFSQHLRARSPLLQHRHCSIGFNQRER